jgi:transcriptional regulator with XRE-family HTH domain
MGSPGRLADYLRARRATLRPEDVGLSVGGGTRRVAGLRREEVAILAGISTDYYLRLEQGRDVHPSDQVLDSLARALKLDAVATVYLRDLARPPAVVPAGRHADVVNESMRWMIDSWPTTAAIVHNRYIDVLASNKLAQALNPNYRPGINSVLALVADPAERALHADWEGLAARSVSLLRVAAESQEPDARLQALVAEASRTSSLFREFWARQDVVRVTDGTHVLHHSTAGELTLQYVRLPLTGTDGQSMFLYFAEPGSPSAHAMAELAEAG